MNTNNINLQIAGAKGLDVELQGTAQICTLMIGKGEHRHPSIPIDYTKDPALILELELELLDAGWMADRFNGRYGWVKECWIDGDTFGEATCKAWLEEFR